MGHDKLRKFAENETFSCLLQPSAAEVLADGFDHLRDHPIKGHWFEYGKVTVGSVAPNNRCHPRHAKRGDRERSERWGRAKRDGRRGRTVRRRGKFP